MKRILLSGLIGAALLAPGVGEATVANWTNTGTLTFPPQVDAVNFFNTGTIDIFTTLPFQTANTLNFYNNGKMFGAVGFRLDTDSTVTGQRRMANSFSNGPIGLIQAQDSLGGFGSGFCIPARTSPSYLLISATNIFGGGRTPGASMIVGANGGLELNGKNVNLARSGLEVLPVWLSAIGSVNIDSTNFFPDVAIFDQYWVQDSYNTDYRLNTANVWQQGFFAVSQPGLPGANPPQIVLFGPAADSYVNNLGTARVGITNFTGSPTNVLTIRESFVDVVTNLTKGAAFVGANLSTQIGFTRGGNNAGGNYDTISVLLSTEVPNAVTGRPEPAYLSFVDTLASFTNRGIAVNLIGCVDIEGRPANYLVDRLPGVGQPGNHGYPENNFFIASGARLTSTNVASDAVTNVVVAAGDYSGYGAIVDNVVLRPPAVPGATVTNLPGRVRITADNLNLSETRIRAEGEIIIQTANLISSSNAVIDCENLSFDLRATNGNLKIQSLAPDTVARLKGNIYAWSAFWSNSAIVVVTNNYEFATNVIDGTNIVATILVTKSTGTTNGQTMTVAGLGVRTWRDNVTNPAVQISTASSIGQAAANLYDQVSNYPFPGIGVSAVGTNGIALQTGPNGNIDVVLSPGWGTVTYATNDSFTNIVATAVAITNTVEMGMHLLILDATELSTTQPVIVHELVTRSANVVVEDNLTIGRLLSFDAQRLTLNGNVTLPQGSTTTNWNNTIAPNVRYFTNGGFLSVFNEAHFGDDLAMPYSAFINTLSGTIASASLRVQSDYLQNNGGLTSTDSMMLQAANGKLENGFSSSGGNTDFLAGTLKFNNYFMSIGGALNFDVTSALFDAGPGSDNDFTVDHGFNLLVKPPTGDLLGTTINTAAPDFSYPEHTWAGQDRGDTAAGYSNNVAIGQLVLGPVGLGPFFTFSGTGTANGLYADLLDLTSLGAGYTNDLQIDPNLTIYYAAAKLGVTPPASNGVTQLPEEYLNGQFGGRLRWVPDYAGANSSTDVVINGKTVKVNTALRNSQIIDSDGDGLPNYVDSTPFDSLVLTGAMVDNNPPTPQAFAITWQAMPNIAYQVEFTTNATLINWQPLTGYTNQGPAKITTTVWDTNATPSAVRRFYRISYRP